MDPTSCPPGYASDIAFKPPNITPSCDVQLLTYWLVNIFFCIFSCASRLLRITRRKPILSRHLAKCREFNMKLVTISSLILVICIGTNQTTYLNGGSFSLHNIYFILCVAEMMQSWLLKVRRKELLINEYESEKLQTLTKFGKIVLIIAIVSVIISSIVMIIVSPLLAIENRQHIAIIGWAFKAAFWILLVTGMVHQVLRTTRAIKQVYIVEQDETKRKLLSKALSKVYLELVSFSITPSIIALLYALLASEIIEWTWHFTLSPMWVEMVGLFTYELLQYLARKKNSGGITAAATTTIVASSPKFHQPHHQVRNVPNNDHLVLNFNNDKTPGEYQRDDSMVGVGGGGNGDGGEVSVENNNL
jgi:hypothetical protein